MFKRYIKIGFFLLFLSISSMLFSQNIGISTTGALPSTNAILDLSTGNSNNMGIIAPHVTLGASLSTFNPPMAHANTANDIGMLVYNSIATNQPIGYYCWSGTTWIDVTLPPAGGNVTGCLTAAANYIPYFTASNVICNSVLYQAAMLGVGTTTPQNMLDIKGALAVGSYAGSNVAPANGMIVSGRVGVDTTAPSSSAIMDVNSMSKGLLLPEMTTAQIAAIAAPANGLMVYNTSTNCIEFYAAATPAWKNIACACSAAPGTPGTITSSTTTNLCVGTVNQTLSVSDVAHGTTYNWTVPAQVGSWTGQGSPSINVTSYTSTGTGTFSVTASNACGTSSASTISVKIGTGNSQTFNWYGPSTLYFDGYYQTWIVPTCVSTITVTAAGGSGGQGFGGAGGKGALLTGTINVTGGDTLYLVVAGQGYETTTNQSGGGGGATWIWDHTQNNKLLVAAGGGGGGGYNGAGANAASTTVSALTLETPVSSGNCGAGGTGGGASSGGAAGAGSLPYSGPAAGGAGWGEDGGNVTTGYYQTYGDQNIYPLSLYLFQFRDSWLGNYGGYGGGAQSGVGGGGGGGGYNGGGGGNATAAAIQGFGGGGGGSYFNNTVPTTAGYNSAEPNGNGYVTITW